MTTTATVRAWHEEEGWGVLDSPQTPGGCWVHVSHVLVAGARGLVAGQEYLLDWEPADQDGYAFRAVRAWPVGAEPVEVTDGADSGAYRSTLTLRFDDGSPDVVLPG